MPPRKSKPKEDPYFAIKEQIGTKLTTLNQSFDQWKYILDKKNTANTDQFQELTHAIQLRIREINQDIAQVSKINSVVEGHRERFPGINDAQLEERKAFVNTTRARLVAIEKDMSSEQAKNKIQLDEKRSNKAPVLKPGQSGDQYIAHRHQQYQAMDNETDEVLEDMSAALTRLHEGSRTVNMQLHEQKEIIADMDDNMTNTQNLLTISLGKMDAVLNKSTKGKWIILGFEIILVILFLILIIYT